MNSSIEIQITGFAFGGRAVGRRSDGKVCFVRGAVPGEKVRVRLTADKKNYSEGVLDEVLEPSPSRLTPDCPNVCPGCSYAHIPYEKELEWKERQFRSFAEKAGLRSDPESFLRPGIGAPVRTGWRNKIRLSLEFRPDGTAVAGYRGEDNRTLIPVTDCPLAVPAIRECLRGGSWRTALSGTEKNITFRWTETDGVRVFTGRGSRAPVTDELAGHGRFQTAENAFFQIDPFMSGKLADEVCRIVEAAAPGQLAELYCGCGCFSILCAERLAGLHCCGIELDAEAVKYARINAMEHGVADRTEFLAGDCAKVFRRKYPDGLPPGSLLLLDPPRTGLDPAMLDLAARSKAASILYVSCSPDTLFRDLKRMETAGYSIRESRMLDLFPSTAHFESVSFLSAGEGC
ncbi:MAG: class I SAM-dependent RNA methyltransferase [Lentisphaeria bacterium]|nr:class I SAM-dependent RNA methyltransferase [Lentisphaeria bacterium]